MKEITRTGIFAAAAVVAIALAVVARMETRFGEVTDDPHALLFPDFQNPSLARSMEIVKYDEDTSSKHDFKIAHVTDETGSTWRIPSHENYPADANTQLAEAASALIGKERGTRASDSRSEHGSYGVLDPTEEIQSGTRGVGTLVSFADESDNKLAEVIVGKEDKDRPGIRYVRLRGQDRVYRVKLDADKFSTKFEDWIERDLLKLDAFRVKEVTIHDTELVPVQGTNRLKPGTKGLLELKHDDSASENRWSLADLAPGEKLEEAKINDMRTALDDLKIVDVHKKPPALSRFIAGNRPGQLTQGEAMQIQMSLQDHGFFILSDGGIFPSDGEVVIQMEDGLQYRLYFGGIAKLTAAQSEKKDSAEGEKDDGNEKEGEKSEGGKKDDGGVAGANRYVFVGVSLNEDRVKKPDIKPLPGEPFLPVKKASEKAEEGKNEAGEKKPADKPKAVTLADSIKELRRLNDEGLIDKAEWEHQRAEVERSNRQAQEQYDSDLKAAQKKEKELNERFADWYYVIDDQMYKKIRLKRGDIVQGGEKLKDEKAKDENGKDENGKEQAKDEKAKSEPAKIEKAKNEKAKGKAADAKQGKAKSVIKAP